MLLYIRFGDVCVLMGLQFVKNRNGIPKKNGIAQQLLQLAQFTGHRYHFRGQETAETEDQDGSQECPG